MHSPQLTTKLKKKAFALGFDFCRIIPIKDAPHASFFEAWIDAGRAGEMTYLERYLGKRRDPRTLADPGLPPFHSLIALAVNYHQFDLPPKVRDDPSRGIIASYAWGDDYHEIIRPLLYELDGFIRHHTGRQEKGKCLVDTGPVLERDWAAQAGIGFTGKNCCTIHPRAGSWLFLATILVPEILQHEPTIHVHTSSQTNRHSKTDHTEISPTAILQGLPPDQNFGTWTIPLANSTASKSYNNNSPLSSNVGRKGARVSKSNQYEPDTTVMGTCGRCTRCMSDCPTDAFVGPFHLDPARCISYWTIEAQGAIPPELRPHFGNRIFGCDICQEVCPWNQRLPQRLPHLIGLHAQQDRIAPPLLEGFQEGTPYWLHTDAFNKRFRRSPVKRAKRHGMARNVCVALGNWADPVTAAPLALALHDSHPVVRGHAAWALGQLRVRHPETEAMLHLVQALETEQDEWVRAEIVDALHLNDTGTK